MYKLIGDALERHTSGEVLRIEPWGAHAVRVRASADVIDTELAWALDLPPEASGARATVDADGTARLVNGRITVEADADGRLRFLRSAASDDGTARELLAEKRPYTAYPGPRVQAARGDGSYRLEQSFEAYDDERVYGLG